MDKAPQEAYDSLYNEDVLERQVRYLRMLSRDFSQYVDCVTSPLWKRVWWWFGGFYFRKVGRWYGYDTVAYKIWRFFAVLIDLT